MNGSMNMNGWMDKYKWMNMNVLEHGWINEWIYELMEGRMNR